MFSFIKLTKLPPFWFSYVSWVGGAIFTIICFFWKEPFFGVCSAFISFMLGALNIWLENRDHQISTEKELLAYLHRKKYPTLDNIIYRERILELEQIKAELDTSVFTLTPDQMQNYTNLAVAELVDDKSKHRTYYASHIVNSDTAVEVWASDTEKENDNDPFVQNQLKLLNRGGEIIRVFIFFPNYFKNNKQKCLDMLEKHETYYKDAVKKITTLCYFVSEREQHNITNDISIVGADIVFEWFRSAEARGGYANGKCMVQNQDVRKFIKKFELYKERSKTISQAHNMK